MQLQAIDIAGRRQEFCDVGSGPGPAMVIVHGGNCAADDWESLAPKLGASHRLILPDGLVHPIDPWLVWLLLDQLGVRDVVMIGHSAGGGRIRDMYRLQPNRVRGMIFIDTEAIGEITLARKIPNDQFSPTAAAALYEKNRARMEQLRPHHRGDYPSDATIECRMRAYQREQMTPEQRVAARPAPKVIAYKRGEVPAPPTPVEMAGKYVKCPALVIHTGRGKIGPQFESRDAARRHFTADDVEYVMIQEAGHWPWLEDESRFLAIIQPFLTRTCT